MKRITILFAVAATCLLASCNQKIEQIVPEESNTVARNEITYIIADGNEDAAAKAAIDNNTAAFTWKTGDQIAVYSQAGYKTSSGLAEGGEATASFAFSNLDDEQRANFALYPARIASDAYGDPYVDEVTASALNVYLPGEYNLSKIYYDRAPLPMIAENTSGCSLAFKQLGALLRFKLVSVPKQTKYITFDFNGKKVQGEFTLSGVVPGTTVLQTSDTTDDDDIITVVNDDVFDTFQKGLILNIPVPTGTYSEVTVTTWDGEPDNGGHKINALTAPIDPSANWTAARKTARKREVFLPVFAISGSNGVGYGKKVVFAPGNLQAVLATKPKSNVPGTASEWRFAAHQYDAIGASMPGDEREHSINSLQVPMVGDVIDLFAWVGGDATGYTGDYADDMYKCGILYPSGSDIDILTGTTDNYSGLLCDWGHNVINTPEGDYPADTWRILTKNEWYKVVLNRGCLRLRATITDGGNPVAYGYVLTPDQYEHPAGVPEFNKATKDKSSYLDSSCSDDVFTLEQWEKLEGAGCVFLPITNIRTKGTNSETIKPADGWYWSSDANTGKNAAAFAFNDIALGASQLKSTGNSIQTSKSLARKCGAAVRLVRIVNDSDI
ncbi:MAG: hypothetical protein J5737_06700 [Bacteroidales bacterium]|nr:hypothetical protein [Bacteroidales bacterium]